jgi:hypothetical protein
MHELLIMYKITKEGKNLRIQTGSVRLSDITEFHRTTFCQVYDHKHLFTSFLVVCPHVSEPFPPNSLLCNLMFGIFSKICWHFDFG